MKWVFRHRDECTFVILKYRPIRKFVFFKFLNSMIRIWIVLLVVEIHLSLLRESCFLLASFWNPDCLHLELTQKICQEIFWTTWCQILKKSELFHVPPKIQRASRWNIIFIISNLFYHFVPFVYNNVERSKIRIWIKWTFFRSLAAITFGNILSWSNQDLDLYPAESTQSTIFNDTPSSWYFIPRFHIQRFLSHTHHKDAQIIKIKILVLIHLI